MKANKFLLIGCLLLSTLTEQSFAQKQDSVLQRIRALERAYKGKDLEKSASLAKELYKSLSEMSGSKKTSSNKDIRVVEFEKLITHISSFFETQPVFSDEERSQFSPSGKIYFLYKHLAQDISYNVEQTNSLTSPLVGQITVQCQVLENSKHTTPADCLADSIFSPSKSAIRYRVFEFSYAYQENVWIFKGIHVKTPEGKSLPPNTYEDDWLRAENAAWLTACAGRN